MNTKTLARSAVKPAGGGTLPLCITLSECEGVLGYVTHMACQREETGKWSTFWGHYFETLDEAVASYDKRTITLLGEEYDD